MPQNANTNSESNRATEESSLPGLQIPCDLQREVANLVLATQGPFWAELDNATQSDTEQTTTAPITQALNQNLTFSNCETANTNPVSAKNQLDTTGTVEIGNTNSLQSAITRSPQCAGNINTVAPQPMGTLGLLRNMSQAASTYATPTINRGDLINGCHSDYGANPITSSSTTTLPSTTYIPSTASISRSTTRKTAAKRSAVNANLANRSMPARRHSQQSAQNAANSQFHCNQVNHSTPYAYTATASHRAASLGRDNHNTLLHHPINSQSNSATSAAATLYPLKAKPTLSGMCQAHQQLEATATESENNHANLVPTPTSTLATSQVSDGATETYQEFRTSEPEAPTSQDARCTSHDNEATAAGRISHLNAANSAASSNSQAASYRRNASGINKRNLVNSQASNNATRVSTTICSATAAPLQRANYGPLHSEVAAIRSSDALPERGSVGHEIPAIHRSAPQYQHDYAPQTARRATTIPFLPPHIATNVFQETSHAHPNFESAYTRRSWNTNPQNSTAQYAGSYTVPEPYVCTCMIDYTQSDGRINTSRMRAPPGAVLPNPLILYPLHPSQNHNVQIHSHMGYRYALSAINPSGVTTSLAESAPYYGLLSFHPVGPLTHQLNATHYAYVYASRASNSGTLHYPQPSRYAPHVIAEPPLVLHGDGHHCVHTSQYDFNYVNQAPVLIPAHNFMEGYTNYRVYRVSVVYPEGNPYRKMKGQNKGIYDSITLRKYNSYTLTEKPTTQHAEGTKPCAAIRGESTFSTHNTTYKTFAGKYKDPGFIPETHVKRNSPWSHCATTVKYLINLITEENIMEQPHNKPVSDVPQKYDDAVQLVETSRNQDIVSTAINAENAIDNQQGDPQGAAALEAVTIDDEALRTPVDTAFFEKILNDPNSPGYISCSTEGEHSRSCTPPPSYTALFPAPTAGTHPGQEASEPTEKTKKNDENAFRTRSYELLPGVTAVSRPSRPSCTIAINHAGNSLSKTKNANLQGQQAQGNTRKPDNISIALENSHASTERASTSSAPTETSEHSTGTCDSPSDPVTCRSVAASDPGTENIDSMIEGPVAENFTQQQRQDGTKPSYHTL